MEDEVARANVAGALEGAGDEVSILGRFLGGDVCEGKEGGEDGAGAGLVPTCVEEGFLEEADDLFVFCRCHPLWGGFFPEADGEVDVEVAEAVRVERVVTFEEEELVGVDGELVFSERLLGVATEE